MKYGMQTLVISFKLENARCCNVKGVHYELSSGMMNASQDLEILAYKYQHPATISY